MSTDLAIRPETVPGIRIDEVIVGERARKDYGDLADLMASISDVGLLQPIGLTPGNHLLFGGRRLEACRRLGWQSIPFVRPETQTDALSLLKAERDENTCRKAMTPEELVDLGLRLEELEAPAAEERKRAGGERGRDARYGSGFPSRDGKPGRNHEGETNTAVGEALGLSASTYHRAKRVVQTARGEIDAEPEVQAAAQEALQALNAGKASVNTAYTKVRQIRKEKPPVKADNLAIPQPVKYGGNRRKHLQVLQAMTTTLSGLAGAVDEITELDNSVTKEEAAQLVRDLSQQIRSLNQIKALLKERTS